MNILLYVVLGIQLSIMISVATSSIKASRKAKLSEKIVERSNVVQLDEFGYPLRLVITADGEQVWRYTDSRENDKVLEWTSAT